MWPRRRNCVRDVREHVTCHLCNGYLIDATTVVKCMHTFCRSCVVGHLSNARTCPTCDTPLGEKHIQHLIRSDPIKQRLVYKLIPGLLTRELLRRRDFLHSSHNNTMTSRKSSECTAALLPLDEQSMTGLYAENDDVSICLQLVLSSDGDTSDDSDVRRRFLLCRASTSVCLLKKFVFMKFSLDSRQHSVEMFYAGEALEDDVTVADVAYTFNWSKCDPLTFDYVIVSFRDRVVLSPQDVALQTPSDRKQSDDVSGDCTSSPEEGGARAAPESGQTETETSQMSAVTSNRSPARRVTRAESETETESVPLRCTTQRKSSIRPVESETGIKTKTNKKGRASKSFSSSAPRIADNETETAKMKSRRRPVKTESLRVVITPKKTPAVTRKLQTTESESETRDGAEFPTVATLSRSDFRWNELSYVKSERKIETSPCSTVATLNRMKPRQNSRQSLIVPSETETETETEGIPANATNNIDAPAKLVVSECIAGQADVVSSEITDRKNRISISPSPTAAAATHLSNDDVSCRCDDVKDDVSAGAKSPRLDVVEEEQSLSETPPLSRDQQLLPVSPADDSSSSDCLSISTSVTVVISRRPTNAETGNGSDVSCLSTADNLAVSEQSTPRAGSRQIVVNTKIPKVVAFGGSECIAVSARKAEMGSMTSCSVRPSTETFVAVAKVSQSSAARKELDRQGGLKRKSLESVIKSLNPAVPLVQHATVNPAVSAASKNTILSIPSISRSSRDAQASKSATEVSPKQLDLSVRRRHRPDISSPSARATSSSDQALDLTGSKIHDHVTAEHRLPVAATATEPTPMELDEQLRRLYAGWTQTSAATSSSCSTPPFYFDSPGDATSRSLSAVNSSCYRSCLDAMVQQGLFACASSGTAARLPVIPPPPFFFPPFSAAMRAFPFPPPPPPVPPFFLPLSHELHSRSAGGEEPLELTNKRARYDINEGVRGRRH